MLSGNIGVFYLLKDKLVYTMISIEDYMTHIMNEDPKDVLDSGTVLMYGRLPDLWDQFKRSYKHNAAIIPDYLDMNRGAVYYDTYKSRYIISVPAILDKEEYINIIIDRFGLKGSNFIVDTDMDDFDAKVSVNSYYISKDHKY